MEVLYCFSSLTKCRNVGLDSVHFLWLWNFPKKFLNVNMYLQFQKVGYIQPKHSCVHTVTENRRNTFLFQPTEITIRIFIHLKSSWLLLEGTCPTHGCVRDSLTDWLTEQSLVSGVCSGLSVAPRLRSQHVSTPPSHNTAVVSLNVNRVDKQEFEEAGLFLNVGLLLFPSWCRVSVRGRLIFNVKQRYCVYRSN